MALGIFDPSSVETTNQTGFKLEYTQRGVVDRLSRVPAISLGTYLPALVASQHGSDEVDALLYPRLERQSGSELA